MQDKSIENLKREELISIIKQNNLQINKLKNLISPQTCLFKNDIDAVNKIIDLLTIINPTKYPKLRDFEKDTLNYYIRFGCDIKVKQRITKELNKNMNSVRQATFYLTKKGYLVRDLRNLVKREVRKEIIQFRDNILYNKKPILAIGFKRNL